jgi:hypothetical protein
MPSAMISELISIVATGTLTPESARGVVLPELVARPERHRRAHDLGLGDGRGDEGQPDRERR